MELVMNFHNDSTDIYMHIKDFVLAISSYINAYQVDNIFSFFQALVILACSSCMLFEKTVPHKQASAKFDLFHLGYSENLVNIIKKIAAFFDRKTILTIIAYILLIIYFLIEIKIKYKKFYF